MPFSTTELEALVRQRAPEIARDIHDATERSRNEADLVAAIERILERFAKHFDVALRLERERTLVNGRADAVYNRLVIEYEPPRSLRKDNTYGANKHAIAQVQQYMEGLERLDRHRKERLAGVVLDGCFFILLRYRDEHWHIDKPLPVNAQSVETFLRYLLSLSTELALTPENLQRDFGENSNVARRVVPALYSALLTSQHPKVGILFAQWHRQFSEITGYERGSSQLDLGALTKSYAIQDRKPDAARLFFALHTYYATFIKLLAVQVALYYLMPKIGTGLSAVANLESKVLRQYLTKMERGGILADFGIKNFVEGDFFGWYLDIWDEALDGALRRMISDLANYSLVTLDVDPEETRDLLKQLYQNLMPRKLRHALGEYYTPDWLAERVLNQLGYRGDPGVRLLDPACGSGTFLVLAIKRVRAYAEEKMLPPAKVLEQVLTNIVGYDLNPLAVTSARTNYLLALGELLPYRSGDINIPVYLADSILTPSAADATGQTVMFAERSIEVQHPGFTFSTAVGPFTVPSSLVTAERIDGFASLLEDCVEVGLSPSVFQQRLRDQFGTLPEAQVTVATDLFSQLLELDHGGINGIWARIIKNAFAPLFQGHFDLVAGNPPWVNWESLPEDYRQRTRPFWSQYGLIAAPQGGPRLGSTKVDISALMTYVVMQEYLRQGGRLGFVITQAVFKASAGRGFRRFTLGDGTPLAVIAVDDMSSLKPFEGAANRTTIAILERGRATRYPMRSYSLWYKRGGGNAIPENTPLEDIGRVASFRRHVAQPVDAGDVTSAWITAPARALAAARRLLGRSSYLGHAGAYTGGANAVYWLEVLAKRPDGLLLVRNITEGAKRKVDDTQTALERDLVYPLLRGGDVRRWIAEPSASILLVHTSPEGGIVPEERMQRCYPRSYAYLKGFSEALAERRDAMVRGLLARGKPFYSYGAVADYTFGIHKVVWGRIATRIEAAVVGDVDGKPVIPQETVSLVQVDGLEEAHYICAVLNSSPFTFAVESHSARGAKSFGTPGILEKVCIPQFDPGSAIHRQLSAASQEAHGAATGDDERRLQDIEAEIDRLAAQLWGLTDEELREIQESLEELS